jgi:hypothetical protein
MMSSEVFAEPQISIVYFVDVHGHTLTLDAYISDVNRSQHQKLLPQRGHSLHHSPGVNIIKLFTPVI